MKVTHTLAASSDTVAISNGQLLVQHDTGRLSVDYNGSRIAITDVVYVAEYPVAPVSDKLYITPGGAKLWHGGSAIELALASNYIPTSEKGAVNGVATLDADGKVPVDELPRATVNSVGAVKTNASYGTNILSDGSVGINESLNAQIDNRYHWRPITPYYLDYAVRSVLPNVTTIPAATTAYSLLDASATTNSHSAHYTHAPTSAPTYTLPAVQQTITADSKVWTRNTATDGTGYYGWLNGSTNRYTGSGIPGVGENTYTDTALSSGAKAITETGTAHSIILDVDFTTVQTCSFEDSEGTTIELQKNITIAAGDCYRFICEYIFGEWKIFPLKMDDDGSSSGGSSGGGGGSSEAAEVDKDQLVKFAFVFG